MAMDMEYAPKMFTRGMNNSFTMLRAGPTPSSLHLVTYLTDGSSYCRNFTESECNKVTNNLEWPKLLENLQSAFVENRCTSSAENDTCYFEVSFSRFKLVKDPEKLIKEISTKEVKSSKRLEDAQAEVERLQECVNSIGNEKMKEELKQMGQEIIRMDKSKKSKGVDREDEEVENLVALARNPLGERQCVAYDMDLLRIVKSLFWPQGERDKEEKEEADAKYMNTIPLYPPSEFVELKKNFPSETCNTIFTLMQKLNDWDFNVFEVQQTLTGAYTYEGLVSQPNGGSLFLVTYCIMVKHGLLEKFNINERILLNWLSMVEAGYHPNPYHNSMHAADVLHVTNFILTAGGMVGIAKLSSEEVFAALFAAAIHDYNHPGINNNFHIKAQTYLSTLFNDKSILESVHLSCVFELMKLDEFNLFECFNEETKRNLKDIIIEMVLATDMGLHAKIISTFKRKLVEDSSFTKKEDVRLALSMAMKMADISNCGRPEELYLKWCDHISDEFYLQGDRERAIGQVISPFMDRYSPNVAKGQIAFMNYIVIPLFECMSEYLPEMHFTIDFCENNKSYWGSK